MPATGEPQSLAPELDPLNMAELLLRRVAGEPFPYSFIHEVSAYSAAPEILVRGRDRDTRGKEMAWYFCSAINVHRSGGTRNRQVGGGGHTLWHPEGGRKQIHGLRGSDGKPVVAYSRKLSYGQKINNPPGAAAAKSFTIRRLGWCMVEVFLEQHAGQRLELCKVYRSPSARSTADPAETTTATAGAVDIRPVASNGVSRVEVRQHDSALEDGAIPEVIGGDMACPPAPAPPPASCDYNVHSPGVARSPALLIGPASIHGSLAIFKKSNAGSVAATVVMKLDGSSIPSAERMKEMARLVFSFDNPVVILSAMGNTASYILLAAWKALSCDPREASKIDVFKDIRELHLRTIADLGLESSIVSGSLDELEHHLQYVATTKDMTSTTRDHLVSIVEATSTKMFFGYLNELGKGTLQEWELRTIIGSYDSDLAAAINCRDLKLGEIEVWKDQGIFTCDPHVCAKAILVPQLTFDEAAELGFLSTQSIQLAMECGISVRVKNSFNPEAPGTLITKTRGASKSTLTIIELKSNITILDIQRTGMLDQSAFVEKAISKFKYFEYLGISLNWVATSDNMSFTLVPSKLLSQELIQPALDKAVKELQKIATVDRLQERSVISLIGNPQMSLPILGKAINVLGSNTFAVEKVPRGSLKVANVSLVVRDNAAESCVERLHSVFFGLNGCPQPGNRVGFGRVDLYQTHAQLHYRVHLMPTTLPMGLILYPCPHPSGNPTL